MDDFKKARNEKFESHELHGDTKEIVISWMDWTYEWCKEQMVRFSDRECDALAKYHKGELKNKILIRDNEKLISALNDIAHIGVVVDQETGQKFDCNPIEVAQNAIKEYDAHQED